VSLLIPKKHPWEAKHVTRTADYFRDIQLHDDGEPVWCCRVNQFPRPTGGRSGHASTETPDADQLAARCAALHDELVAFRRDLHSHPELGHTETRTTGRVVERLRAAGLDPRVLPGGTGAVCDIEPSAAPVVGTDDGVLALRADIDALPIPDVKDVPYRSTVPGVCHACGHDVHTSVVLGAGLLLAELADAGLLRRRVRLIFQPAEEVLPGGSHHVIEAGGLRGVQRILGLHCDPRIDVGTVGVRTGAITAACDKLLIKAEGPGGHTARPHLTADLVYALSALVTELPAALSRRVDPRAGLSLVWGRISAGHAPNAIPQRGEAEGTVRCLDEATWHHVPDLIHELVDQVAGMYGIKTELAYVRGVPPVVNEGDASALLHAAASHALGPDAVVGVEQSLGGEDFAWYLQQVPGAMARLGVRDPADRRPRDLHQGTFDVDERAIGVGVRTLVAAALM
jgi:amidohydrolase